MSLHPSTNEAIDTIDAGFFSGNEFHSKEDLAEIENYLGRWNREVVRIKEQHMEQKVLVLLAGRWSDAVEEGLYTDNDLPLNDIASEDTPTNVVAAATVLTKMNEASLQLVEQGYFEMQGTAFVVTEEGCEYAEELINGC